MGNVYIDFNASTGVLTGTWTFTNGAGMTAAADGDAVNELANGDYVRQSDGTQWYKVTARPDADTITLSPVFQQATHTDDVGASLYNDTSASGALNTDYVHHNQATTDTVRTAGDIIRTRGGLTYTYAGIDITFDEDGTANLFIELRGIYTAAGDDSWGDGDIAKPVIDFGNTAFQMTTSLDRYWKIQSFQFVESADGAGALTASGGGGVVDDCDFHDNANIGLTVSNSALVTNCTFEDNGITNLRVAQAPATIDNCVFNGGASGTQRGISCENDVNIILLNSTFGLTTEHSTADIATFFSNFQIYGRNVLLDSTTQIISNTGVLREQDFVRIEDYQQVHGAYRGFEFAGDVMRETASPASPGGTPDWILVQPNSDNGLEQALHGLPFPPRGIPIYLDAVENTVGIYIRVTSWGTLPLVNELVMSITYRVSAGVWATVTSSDTISANDAWELFEITLTPGVAGDVELNVALYAYEDGTEAAMIDFVPYVNGSRDESLIVASVDGMTAAYEIVQGGGMLVHPGMTGGIRG